MQAVITRFTLSLYLYLSLSVIIYHHRSRMTNEACLHM
jgi:hypothetical protein